MRINPIQRIFNFYITGSFNPPAKETHFEKHNNLTDEELSEMEMTRDEWSNLNKKSYKFKNPVLTLSADWNTMNGYFRNAALGVFDSLFSGVGQSIARKIPFASGVSLAGLSLITSLFSTFKKLPLFSDNFSFTDFGGRLSRASLRVLDSTFSYIGEQGAKLNIPSIASGLLGIFSLVRVLNGKNDNKVQIPYSTIGGTLGRTAIHHMESMLASKANEFSTNNESMSAFLAGSVTTFGLLMPKEIKTKKIPVESLEGLFSLLGPHFLDSLFTNIGNALSPIINKPRNLFLSTAGFAASLPVLSSFRRFWNYKAPLPEFGGKLIRSINSAFESIAFNAGNSAGKSILGVPLALSFSALTYLTTVSKNKDKIFKSFKVPMDTVGSLFQRLPFDFIYSMMSTVGTRLSKLVPAPLLVFAGPLISFKIGEKCKGINARYDDFKGLMVRNSVHLWESILASAGYRTGKMILQREDDDIESTGALLGEQWITDDGQIVKNMAIGKQINTEKEKSISKIFLSAFSGIAFGAGIHMLAKYLIKSKPLDKEVSSAVAQAQEIKLITKPVPNTEKHPIVIQEEVAYAA